MFRALYPDSDPQLHIVRRLAELTERVEVVAVIAAQTQIRLGQLGGVPAPATIPRSYADLITQQPSTAEQTEAQILAGMAELDRFLEASTTQ